MYKEYYDFYEKDVYYKIWYTGKCYMMQKGYCNCHVMFPKRRISKDYYMELKQLALQYKK